MDVWLFTDPYYWMIERCTIWERYVMLSLEGSWIVDERKPLQDYKQWKIQEKARNREKATRRLLKAYKASMPVCTASEAGRQVSE